MLGTTWTIVDDFQLVAGEHSNPSGLATAAPNTIYAVGVARQNTFNWHVRRSVDGGANWEDVDTMSGGASEVVVAPNGNVFVVGTSNTDRLVRRSVDGGDSWETVDTVPLSPGACSAGSLVVASDGTVYVGGGCDLDGLLVRRSTDGGDTWEDVDTFIFENGAASRMGTLGIDANDRVYAGGNGSELDGVLHWIVRSGTESGSWTTVDDFQLAAGSNATSNGFGGRTAIYAAGYARDASFNFHWIVRRADIADPTAWTTVDDLGAADAIEEREARSLYEDPMGTFIVAGNVLPNGGVSRAIFRRSEDGMSWQDMGEYNYVTDKPSSAVGNLVADAAGNVYGMIRGVDANDTAHWIVRKLGCE